MWNPPALALALSLTLIGPVQAQVPNTKFRHLTIEDGLSQGTVNTILQDRTGFLWFATADGLNRYDGRGMRVHRHRQGDPGTLTNNFTRHLIEARDGTFWIATKHGLNRFDPATGSYSALFHDPHDSTSLSSDNIMVVLEDRQGTIWVGTWGGGLNALDPVTGACRRFDLFVEGEELARGNIVNSIHEASGGTLWVAAITGLFSRSPGDSVFRRHSLEDPDYQGSRDNIAIDIHEDDAGVLWMGTYTGLLAYDPVSGTRTRYPLDPTDPKTIARNQIRYVIEDVDGGIGDLWLATAFRGLAHFDAASGAIRFLAHDPGNPKSLIHNSLRSLYRDPTGTLWIGTDGQGVDRLTPMTRRFPHVVDLPGDRSIWSFCVDRSGALWVGTSEGLLRQDPGTGAWRMIRHRPDDPTTIGAGTVNAICQDRRGTLWFATATAGLSRLDDPTPFDGRFRFTTYRHDSSRPGSLSGDRLLSLIEDRAGRLWIGTVDDGAAVLDPNTGLFAFYRPDKDDPASLSDNSIECIYEDTRSAIWMGTLSGGLNRLDPSTGDIRRYVHDPSNLGSLSDNHVTSVLEGHDGRLWVSTANGLNCLDPETGSATRYFVENGLPNNYIYGLLLDDEGLLWMGTNRGLSRFDPRNGTFRNFTTDDGLQGNEFNAGAYHGSPEGELFFGGHNGFNRFHPDAIRDNLHRPPVVITDFRILGEPASLDRPVHLVGSATLTHREVRCSFEFAALDFWAPERNSYQYRMEGLDPDWIDAGTRNYASYTNLAPGSYTFRVRGANSDGVWNETGATLELTVTPPFWKRGWFLALAAASGLAVVLGVHRYRVRRLLELERLRTRISADLHDEIATNLSSIAMYSGMILETGEPGERSRQLLDRLRSLAEDSVGSIRDIIWALNPTTGTLHGLLLRLRDHLVPVCRGKGIELIVDLPDEHALPERDLVPEVRHHLWLLLKEAVNNAIKHADCRHLGVTAVYGNGRLQVKVTDDGRGFDPTAGHDGHGLRSMTMRAKQLHGRLRVESSPGAGTHIDLDVAI